MRNEMQLEEFKKRMKQSIEEIQDEFCREIAYSIKSSILFSFNHIQQYPEKHMSLSEKKDWVKGCHGNIYIKKENNNEYSVLMRLDEVLKEVFERDKDTLEIAAKAKINNILGALTGIGASALLATLSFLRPTDVVGGSLIGIFFVTNFVMYLLPIQTKLVDKGVRLPTEEALKNMEDILSANNDDEKKLAEKIFKLILFKEGFEKVDYTYDTSDNSLKIAIRWDEQSVLISQ